jgi:16S rRNA (uracil1498-N3)-methyltransferase
LVLFDPERGLEADATIREVDNKDVLCDAGPPRVGERVGVLGLHLVQGLGKGDKPEQVLRDAVVLGAQSVSFVICERSVAQSTERDTAKKERLMRIAVDAARQCGRSNLPEIRFGLGFDAALEQDEAAPPLVLHPDETALPVEAVLSAAPRVLAVKTWIGPEGGFSENELQRLIEHHGRFASLGQLVLRTELAAVVALARIGAWLEAGRVGDDEGGER